METNNDSKPTVKLAGEDGNIFYIMGRCIKVAKRAGWSAERIKSFTDKVTASSNYDDALCVVMDHFDVE